MDKEPTRNRSPFRSMLMERPEAGVPLFAVFIVAYFILFDSLLDFNILSGYSLFEVIGAIYIFILALIGLIAVIYAARVGNSVSYQSIQSETIDLKAEGNESISAIFSQSRSRLIAESARVHQISIMNLLMGLFFCLLGIGILGYSVVSGASFSFEDYLPRASVGILVQLIGYFFLRLFHSGEADVRFNKNEITNLELKMASVLMANSEEQKIEIVRHLSAEDRNFASSDKQRVATEQKVEIDDYVGKLKELASIFFGK